MLILFASQSFSQVTVPYHLERWADSVRLVTGAKTVIVDGIKNPVLVDPGAGVERMPIKKIENKGVYRYNNGKGFDVYTMQADNMPCLVPDSTFQSRFPNATAPAKKYLLKRP